MNKFSENQRPCALKRAAKHFATITRHRHTVIYYCARAGILWQGLRHDLSKYTPTEFFAGVKYFQGYRSPNEAEREATGASSAWMHHKGRNRHHFEYWTDYDPAVRGKIRAVEMPYRYVVEMLCDRLAASRIYNGKNYSPDAPLKYFMPGKPNRLIHPATSDLIESLLRMVAEQGEDATLLYVRQTVAADRRCRREKRRSRISSGNNKGVNSQ